MLRKPIHSFASMKMCKILKPDSSESNCTLLTWLQSEFCVIMAEYHHRNQSQQELCIKRIKSYV